MAGQQPPADGGANNLMNEVVNGPGPTGPPIADPSAGGYNQVMNNLVNPPAPAQAPPAPSTEGKTDAQVAQDLAAQDFDTRFVQGKLFGGGPVTYGAEAGGGGGGGYKFDPQHLESTLTKLQNLRMDTMQDDQHLYPIANCEAPAPDADSSQMQAKAVRDYGNHLRQQNQQQINILNQRIQELQGAKRQYMQQEQITDEQWQRLTKGMQA